MSVTLADYSPTYNLCRFCLMCRHVCPVGRATKREANTPHGWALLISSVDRGQMTWDAEAVDTLYHCAQCGLCWANCITDQPLPLAIAAARAKVVAAGSAPTSVMELDDRLRCWGNPFQEVSPIPVNSTARTALFVGAAAYHLRPQTLAAARRLLEALGVEYVSIGVGLSSAYLPHALGLRETACLLAQSALHEVAAAKCSRLMVLTAEDAHTFLHIQPELGLPLPDGVELVELISLLAEALEAGRLSFRRDSLSLTYHDPAFTPLFLSRAAKARRVLSALTTAPLREMFWRQGRASPGGAAGGLRFTHPALAEQMTRDRLAEAAATGADLLVTEDPAALASFAACSDGAPIQIEGLYELLAQHLA
jgi:Fe-S oxidoreductase